ncbi:MAG TPA: zinc-ribbon domain-containing protein [Clostridiaceae bacterium]|nr:zinc-ribbon domain-containing protein [Clostridiaceae bacterium]
MADIFDKLKSGLNKGVASVSAGSKALIEKAKINSRIKTLEDEKKQLSELLGAKVYNLFMEKREVSVEEIEGFCNEITKRNEQIKEQQQRLEELEAELNQVMGNTKVGSPICKCGNENPPGAKFCSKCGSAL